MPLKQLAPKITRSRVALSMRASILADLELYQVFYAELYGEEVDRNALLEALVEQFLARDVQFQAFKSRHATVTTATVAGDRKNASRGSGHPGAGRPTDGQRHAEADAYRSSMAPASNRKAVDPRQLALGEEDPAE